MAEQIRGIHLRCESCSRPMLDVVFRIRFRDDVWFDVCEVCAPIEGEDRYVVETWSIRREQEKYMEYNT